MKNVWNDNWRSELESTDYLCYIRLCECRNSRKDMIKMARLMFKYNPWSTADDCLIRMMEWVSANNQFYLTDLTQEEFKKALDIIRKM